jgi:transcription initiation factor TFIID subunit 6
LNYFFPRLDQITDASPDADKAEANSLRDLIIKIVCPVLKNVRSPPDNVDDFKKEFGTIGI